MNLSKLLVYFETSPALSLLRADNAPFIVDFLHREFKQAARISIAHSELLTALVSYQEELHESYPGNFIGKADAYLSDWCARGTRWLQRFLESNRNEPVYQLTPHTEDVFGFLDRVLQSDIGFVGTESRLKLVIDTLADLVIGSSDDPQTRLALLYEERSQIEQRIAQIEVDGSVGRYQSAQIRERFATAVSLLRQLQGDFRAVEEAFRDITAQVQQRQLDGRHARGHILEFALDAEDLLKEEDQGVSFYEFVRLVLSPSQTERLEKIITDVRDIPELYLQMEGMEAVRGMITLLQSEAEKVMRTNQRLSATLRRLLDGRAHAERQRIAQLLRDIQGEATRLAGAEAAQQLGLSLDVELAIESPFRRTFWSEPARFETIDLSNFVPDPVERQAAFSQLAALRHLDWKLMRQTIRQLLTTMHAPTIRDLHSTFSVDGGVVELIGYLQIAAEDGHAIDRLQSETVILAPRNEGDLSLSVTLPRVTFLPDRRNGHAD